MSERTKKFSSVVFITYDGILDPLGRSQILPYVLGIAKHQDRVQIISFEKRKRYNENSETMRTILHKQGVYWSPISFTHRVGKLGKLWDLWRMLMFALLLHYRHEFTIIHCRSYQAMLVGAILQKFKRPKIIFDMRGLWVDDRVDGGLWPQNNHLYKIIYYLCKKVERRMLVCADHIVVLTKKVLPEIKKIAPNARGEITVIPCCAEFDHYQISELDRSRARLELGIDQGTLLLSYIGSLGTVYLLKEMLELYKCIASRMQSVHFLIITTNWDDCYERLITELNLDEHRGKIHVRTAEREQVPKLLGASDIMLSFRKAKYSQIACSPTKLAEGLALGIPVISNSGVGDVVEITRDLDAGVVIDLDDPQALDQVAADIETVMAKGGPKLRIRSRNFLDIEVAHQSYANIYNKLNS